MQKQNQAGNSKAERGGDTSRSSSQGRKASSGGREGKRGDPQMDEATKGPVAGKEKGKNNGKNSPAK